MEDASLRPPDAHRRRLYLPWQGSSGNGGDSGVSTEWLTGIEGLARGWESVLVQIAYPASPDTDSSKVSTESDPLSDESPDAVLALDPLLLLGAEDCPSAARELRVWSARWCQSATRHGLSERVILAPLVAGLVDIEELDALLDVVVETIDAVVPVPVSVAPRTLRRFIDFRQDGPFALPEQRIPRMFHGQAPSRNQIATMAARHGLRWWFDTRVHRIGDPWGSKIRASRELALIAELGSWLGRGTGFVEGHLQAARRLGELVAPLESLLDDGNLRILEWLDPRARTTLEEWFESSPALEAVPPCLDRMRPEFVANCR